MNDNFWYPREPLVFLADTCWCDAATEVAHNRLTDTYYALGRPIADNDEEVRNIGKIAPDDYRRVKGNLERLGWRFEDGFLRHSRIEETLHSMEQISAVRSAAGKTGAAKRWQNDGKANGKRNSKTNGKGMANGMANAMRPHIANESGQTELDGKANGKQDGKTMAEPFLEPENGKTIANPMANAWQTGWQNDASNSNSNIIKASLSTGEHSVLSDQPVELPHGFPRTVEEARIAAAFVGCPDDFADKVWNKAMSRGGRDARESQIRQWRFHLATEWSYETERNAKAKTANETRKPNSANRNEGTFNTGKLSPAALAKVL